MDDSLRRRVPQQWDDQLDRLRKQLPSAPDGVLNAYARWVPVLAIVFGVIGLFLGLLAVVGSIVGSVLLATFGGGSGAAHGFFWLVSSLLFLIASVLGIAGGIRMRQGSVVGWWIIAATIVIGALGDLLAASILGLIIYDVIAWIHLQVKPRYS